MHFQLTQKIKKNKKNKKKKKAYLLMIEQIKDIF